jgi:carboxylesterase
MTDTLIPGAEPWSHVAGSRNGALVLHGFTGNPGSMRGVAEAFAAAGFDVELPRLPGHGTTVEDMLTTTWADWSGEAEAAYQRLAARCAAIVVAGLSMGGSLTLWLAGHHPDLAGIVCVNPATQPQPPEVLAMLESMIADGTIVMPGIGSDIADPDAKESAYEGTPLPCLLDFMREGLAKIEHTYESLRMPLLLLNSPQDHVVEPAQAEFLATHYGGPIERISLDRSYHVATQDFDKELIFTSAVEFANRAINS